MAGEKYKNRKLKKYFEKCVKTLSIDKEFAPMIVDILMRRADTYDLSQQDIEQDALSLMHNLKNISIGEMPEEYKTSYGLYYPAEKRILISQKLVEKQDETSVYQTITHEVYHALSKDENGRDRLGGYNTITGQYNSSLLEAIVEKSSYRAVYGNDKQESPYFNRSAKGYGNITFIVDLLEATYGTSEQEFLENAIMGRERLASFLASRSGETPDSAYTFLDAIETNYAMLHKTLYPHGDKAPTPYERSMNITSSLSGIYKLCENKMSERIKRAQVTSYEDMVNLNDELMYDHNKLAMIMEDRTSYFSKCFDLNIYNNVYANIDCDRGDTLTQINDIGSVVNAAPNFSNEQHLVTIYQWAAQGQLGNLDPYWINYYGVQRDFKSMLPVTQDIVNRAFDDEKLGPQYDNSKVPKMFKKIKGKDTSIFKTGIDKLKSLFSRKNQQLLESGEMPQASPQIEEVECSTIFPKLTQEQQEFYNSQVRQAVENLDKNQSEQDIDKDIENEGR